MSFTHFSLPVLSAASIKLLGSQPALGLGLLGVTASLPAFANTKLGITGTQTSFVRVSGVSTIQQPLYVGGVALALLGSQPAFGYGVATLGGSQPAHLTVISLISQSLPLCALGETFLLLGAQSIYGTVRTSVTNTAPLFVKTRDRIVSAASLFVQVSTGIEPNPIQARYKPRPLVTLTIGAETKRYSSEDIDIP